MVETAWQLYDDLIDLIPAELTVTDALLSRVALVRNSAGGVGTASNDGGGGREEADDRPVVGRPLRDVAALVRSWDFALASLGVAALNSWLNSAARLDAVGNLDGVRVDRRDVDVFAARASELAGLRVALIGHFSQGIRALGDSTELTVLERVPRGGDLPDSACEFVLPRMDVVFITGMTVANKTLPRLLELSSDARVILTGPSVPCCPEVFAGSVQHLASSYVHDGESARSLAAIGARSPQLRPATTRFVVDIGEQA